MQRGAALIGVEREFSIVDQAGMANYGEVFRRTQPPDDSSLSEHENASATAWADDKALLTLR